MLFRSKQTAQCEAPLHAHQKIGTYTHHLSEAGLAFPPDFGQVLTPPLSGADMDCVPFALAQYFPPLLETVVHSSREMESSDAAHVVQMADPLAIVRAVQNLLLLFEQEPPRLRPPQARPYIEKYQTGWREWTYIPDEVVRLFAQKPDNAPGQSVALTVPPPAYALEEESTQRLQPLNKEPAHLDFLYALMVAAGLLQTGSPVTPWPQARDEYLTRNAERQHAVLVQTYFRMNRWTELWEAQRRSPDLQLKRQSGSIYLKPQTILDSLAQLRHQVLRFLAYLPDHQIGRAACRERG